MALAEMSGDLSALSPPEPRCRVAIEEMAMRDAAVWIARDGEEAIGHGALKRLGGGVGEVTRIYVHPSYQGRGIASEILARIEAKAHEDGLQGLMLETGDRNTAAWRLYEKAGFTRREPFAACSDTPRSVFYEKRLAPCGSAPETSTMNKKNQSA